MKFTANREEIIEALRLVAPAVANKSTLIVLQNVKIEAAENSVAFSATNLTLSLTTRVPAKVDAAGATTIRYTVLAAILAEMDDQDVAFTLDSSTEKTSISSATAESVLNGTMASEFPQVVFTLTDDAVTFELPVAWFVSSVSSVLFSVSTDETRPTLTTMLWTIERGAEIRMVAVDGFRLAIRQETWSEPLAPPERPFSVLLPGESLASALKTLRGDDKVRVTFNCNVVRFETEQAEVMLTLSDYRYPDYEVVIPKVHHTFVRAEKARLLKAARLAHVIAHNDKTNAAVSLQVIDSGTALELAAVYSDVGENAALCRGIAVEGQIPQQIMGVNCAYLIDALAHCPGDTVEIALNSPAEPLVVRSPGSDQWRCVVMPINLAGSMRFRKK